MVLLELSVFRLFGILNRMRLLICILLFLENATAQNVYHFDRNVDNDVLNQQYSKSNSVPTFAFAKHFQSHMVLQQAPNSANIYGFSAEIGQTINMQVIVQPSLILYHYKTTSQQGPESGVYVWNLLLDPFPGNTAVDIYVQSEDGSLALNDILFGDVWVCSGQSNMQFTVIQMYDAEKEMDEARFYPNIRLMTVKMNEASTPLYDFLELEQSWTAPNRSTVGGPAGTYFSAVCWLYGKAIHKARGYPIGLVATDYGGTPAEAWSSPEALAACGNLDRSSKENSEYYNKANQPEIFKYKFQNPSDNSVLWNAMIHPLLGMTIYGVLWYQGESDAYGPPRDKYNCTFPTMIKDWRYNFNKFSNGQTRSDFPFGFVQLSAKAADPSILVGFPDIRWHQTADYGYVPNPDMPKVFMAVAMDLPDFTSPYGYTHPRDKQDVAARLLLSGLAVAYGQPELYLGPLPVQAFTTSQGLIVDYGKTWKLDIRNWDGFEMLCGSRWAQTSIIANNDTTVTLFADVCGQGEKLTGIRYAWRESPCAFKKCAVYEIVNNLPAPPFVAFAKTNGDGIRLTLDGPTYL